MSPGLTSMVDGTRKGGNLQEFLLCSLHRSDSSQLQPRARCSARRVRVPQAGHPPSILHPASPASSRRRWISPGKALVGSRISGVVGLCVAVTAEKQN